MVVDARRRRVPRHGRGHRLAHHDDQRARRPRVGGRRHRGGGGDARPADLAAPARRARRAHVRCPARRNDRDGPGAHAHPDAARPRRGRQVRGVLRGRAVEPARRRPSHARRTCVRSTAPPSAYFPVDDATLALPPFTDRGRPGRPLVERSPRNKGSSGPTAMPSRGSPRSSTCTSTTVVPSMAGPKRPQDRVALPAVWDSFVKAFRDHASPTRGRSRSAGSWPKAGPPATSGFRADEDVSDTRDRHRRRHGPRRQRRDRRDHVVHEHVEPLA